MLRPKYILKPQHLPYWRRHPDLNWGIKVLQTSALPLGYSAILFGAEDGTRTRNFHLGKVTLYHWVTSAKMVARTGIEPVTRGFSVLCSTDWAIEPKYLPFVEDIYYYINKKFICQYIFYNISKNILIFLSLSCYF